MMGSICPLSLMSSASWAILQPEALEKFRRADKVLGGWALQFSRWQDSLYGILQFREALVSCQDINWKLSIFLRTFSAKGNALALMPRPFYFFLLVPPCCH